MRWAVSRRVAQVQPKLCQKGEAVHLSPCVTLPTMNAFTEEEVLQRLREGWSLSGDISKEAPFSLLNPQHTLQAKIAMIPVTMVRKLSYRRLLKPEPMLGKKAMYRLAQ